MRSDISQAEDNIILYPSESVCPKQPPKVITEYTRTKPLPRWFPIAERMMDLIAACVGLVLLAPIYPIIAMAIRLESPGPVIYRQERLLKGGACFTLYKFRSMDVDAEQGGAQWAARADPRVTRVGAFLRCCRLDELPQLYNVLKGEMTLVGPRPERPVFYEQFSKTIPHFYQRLLVKPGLTGLAQINGGYDLTPEEKLQYDLEYIARQSLGLNMICLFKTIRIVLFHVGAR